MNIKQKKINLKVWKLKNKFVYLQSNWETKIVF